MEKRPPDPSVNNLQHNVTQCFQRPSTCGNSGKYPFTTACHSLKAVSKYRREPKKSSDVFPYSKYNQARRKQTNIPRSIPSTQTLSTFENVNENVTKTTVQLGDVTRLFEKDSDGDTILHLAIVHNDQAKIKVLVQKMRERTLDVFNKLHQTPLHLSVLTCQPAIVRFLVINGADVNARDRNGQTPLHHASKNADIDSVKAIKEGIALRQKGQGINYEQAECNLKNYQGQAAMHLAVLSGSQEIAMKLLDMDADINIQDGTSGRTPLHHAVEAQNINMVQFLLQNNANVNAITFAGNTALHIAMGHHMEQIIRALIKYGANINLKNIEGDTPFNFKSSRRKIKKE